MGWSAGTPTKSRGQADAVVHDADNYLESGRPYLALGRGGSRIITAVAQTILNYHVFGMSLLRQWRAALSSPVGAG